MLMINLNLWMCAWLVDAKPFSSKKLNRIETFNEIVNLGVTYFLIVQNNNKGGDDLYIMGVWLNNLIMGLFFTNVAFLLFNLGQEQVLKWKRRRYIRKMIELGPSIEAQEVL